MELFNKEVTRQRTGASELSKAREQQPRGEETESDHQCGVQRLPQ